MHFLAVTFYGLVIWLSVLAWAAIAGPPGAVLLALALAPVVVSAVMGLLVLVAWLRWLWLSRAACPARTRREPTIGGYPQSPPQSTPNSPTSCPPCPPISPLTCSPRFSPKAPH